MNALETGTTVANQSALQGAYRKVTWYLIPFIFICYLFNYFDRVNVGFAKLQMLDDLGLSETVYGLGAGIFFIGYVLSGIPSNLILHKIGARRVIGTLMIIWGMMSTGLMFVNSATTFYVLRFLTGVFEAGFFPGIVLYFTLWYPASHRGRIMGLFMAAIPISGVIGSPLSGWMLEFFSAKQGGLAGWQWLFLLQGIPTVLLGFVAYKFLSDGIAEANWLSHEEKSLLIAELEKDEKSRPKDAVMSESFASIFRNVKVWILGLIYFCIIMGVYAINFWLPTIIKSLGFQSSLTIGWLSAIPYLFASVFMVWIGRSADAKRERRWHLCISLVMGFLGLIMATQANGSIVIAIIGLTIATMGIMSGMPLFWPLPAAFLSSAAAAGGIALINSIGQIAGFVSPSMVGYIKDVTGSTNVALYILSTGLLIGAFIVMRLPAKLVNR